MEGLFVFFDSGKINLVESLCYDRIKLGAGASQDLVNAMFSGQSVAVRPVGCHCIVTVGNSNDFCPERDLITADMLIISFSIIKIMMMDDYIQDLLINHRLDYAGADGGMRHDVPVLILC